MSGNNDGWSFNRFDEYEAKQKQAKEAVAEEATTEEEVLEEGIDFKGAKRIDDARQAKRDALYKKSPSTKQKDLMKGKFRPGASDEERKSGYRDIMKEKGTQPVKDGKPMFNKEELEATGLFSAEEIEALVEASCGSKGYQKGGRVGYQEGGEVKCDKCEGKGCEHCKGKGTHSKKEKGAKPDYLDFDKDGNKEEPMKDALKEKGGKKS